MLGKLYSVLILIFMVREANKRSDCKPARMSLPLKQLWYSFLYISLDESNFCFQSTNSRWVELTCPSQISLQMRDQDTQLESFVHWDIVWCHDNQLLRGSNDYVYTVHNSEILYLRAGRLMCEIQRVSGQGDSWANTMNMFQRRDGKTTSTAGREQRDIGYSGRGCPATMMLKQDDKWWSSLSLLLHIHVQYACPCYYKYMYGIHVLVITHICVRAWPCYFTVFLRTIGLWSVR